MPGVEGIRRASVDHVRPRGDLLHESVLVEIRRRRRRRGCAVAVEGHHTGEVRRARRQLAQELADEQLLLGSQQRVVSTLVADRRARLAAQAGAAAQRAADVGGPQLHLVAELQQLTEARAQVPGTGVCLHGQVRSREIADEQRVAGEVGHDDRQVLRAVSRSSQCSQTQSADLQRVARGDLGVCGGPGLCGGSGLLAGG